jgi:tRNA threonylcarbamoyladenosine modification (KEOPS) complex  Pcc1 subunit
MALTASRKTEVRDEGAAQGIVDAIDFVGAGVAATVSGNVATVTISGGGGGGAPTTVDYFVGTADATLTAERVATNSTTNTFNVGTAGQFAVERAALTGDVTASANSNATTIAAGVVTNAKLATAPANTIKGNNTGSAATPLDLTVAQTKTLLAIVAADVSGLAAIATSGSATDLSAGTIPTARQSQFTGDVTSGPNATVNTIAAAAVTYAKIQNANANTVIARAAASSGSVGEVALAASQLLGRGATGDVAAITLGTNLSMSGATLNAAGGGGGAPTGAEYIVASADATLTAERVATASTSITVNIATGGQAAFERAALTGDVTAAANNNATTIAAGAVTNAKMANMAANTIKGNNTGSAAAPIDLTAAQTKTLLAITAADVSGLAAVATSGSAADLSAGTLPAARMPAHTGDVTSSAGSVALAIAANAVTNTQAADMPANTLKGNNTGATQDPIDLTVTQATAMLNLFTSALKGLVPASGGGTTTFLRADGTFAAPSGGGGGTSLGVALAIANKANYLRY